jgi:hypothetical protein
MVWNNTKELDQAEASIRQWALRCVPKGKKRYYVVGAQDTGHWIELDLNDYGFNKCREKTIKNIERKG